MKIIQWLKSQNQGALGLVAAALCIVGAFSVVMCQSCSTNGTVKTPTRAELDQTADYFCQARAAFKLVEPPFDVTAEPARAVLEVDEDAFCAKRAAAKLAASASASAPVVVPPAPVRSVKDAGAQ
jgi:hypothetical protein